MNRLCLLLLLTPFLALSGQVAASDPPSVPTTATDERMTIIEQGDLHRWQRHVRGFRKEHNFGFTAGISKGVWQVNRFGTITSEKYSNSGMFSEFQYSFHISLYKGFGYFLGSSFGYHFESTDSRRSFKPVSAVMFPGILGGLVLNFSPTARFTIAGDLHLERHDGLEERDGVEEDPKIAVTFQTLDFSTALDVFYNLHWAVRATAHFRTLKLLAPTEAEGKPVDADITKSDTWLGLGLVYHLL